MRQSKLFAATTIIALRGAMVVGCGEPSQPPTSSPTFTPPPTEIVTFPDDNLDKAIRDTLGKPVGEEITVAELATLTKLSAESSDITDLSSLEYCTSLTKLALWQNQISDISPLVENSGLGEGDEVVLAGNNLDLRESSDDMDNIRALEDRGVVVHY